MMTHYYRGSFIKALIALYPELKLQRQKFRLKDWREAKHRRNFLDEFARSKHFNPLEVENWYSVSSQEIIRAGGRGVLRHHEESHIKALIALYPELMFRKEKFPFYRDGEWKETERRRQFFDEFAKSKQFNPLDAEKWYSIKQAEIRRACGDGILYYYKRSHIKALIALYPELSLRKEKFQYYEAKAARSSNTVNGELPQC